MRLHNDDPKDKPVDIRPFLFIPYWTIPMFPGDPGDTGTVRPLPSGVISWMCDGIHATSYVVGKPLDVWVNVVNSGPGNSLSLALVLVYWSEPVAGGMSNPVLFGAQSVPVPPRGGTVTTPVMTGIVATASPHICLFALVTHDLDKPGPIMDPINDRHWAQHNLQTVTIGPKKVVHLPFTVASPLPERGNFEINVTRPGQREMETLGERLKAVPRLQTDSLQVRLLDNAGNS